MHSIECKLAQLRRPLDRLKCFCRGVAMGWTGMDMSTQLLQEAVPEIDTNPVSRGSVRLGWSLTSQSLPYVNFKVAVLEFAYKWRWFWIVLRKYSTLDNGCLSSVWATAQRLVSQGCDIVDKPGLAYVHSWTTWSLPWNLSTGMHLAYCTRCAGYERAFSKICLVKDELRSMMGDERLNGLMLMAVEKNIAKDFDLQTFVDTFALKPRKLKL